MQRQDKLISFFWSYNVPHSSLHAPDDNNHFSVRWSGEIHPPKSGQYEFFIMHPHSARLYINERLDIDHAARKGGQEITQLYIKDHQSELPRPPKKLKAFDKLPYSRGNAKKPNRNQTPIRLVIFTQRSRAGT